MRPAPGTYAQQANGKFAATDRRGRTIGDLPEQFARAFAQGDEPDAKLTAAQPVDVKRHRANPKVEVVLETYPDGSSIVELCTAAYRHNYLGSRRVFDVDAMADARAYANQLWTTHRG